MLSLLNFTEIFFSQLIYIPSLLLLNFLSYIQREPYMDEVFHVNQTKSFLVGNFTYYDPMITTPPGLYIFGYFISKPVIAIFPDINITYILRHTNVVITPFAYLTLSHIVNELTPDSHISPLKACASAFNILCLPLIYFFNLFYYTDHSSLLFVLLSLKLTLHHSNLAFIPYFLACLCRQTSLIWINFAFGILFVREFNMSSETNYHFYSYLVALWRIFCDPFKVLKTFLQACIVNNFQICIVNLLFIIFFFLNDKSLALGDRSMHKPCFHAMQVLYFVSFCAVFTPFSFCKFCLDFFFKFLPFTLKRLNVLIGSLCLSLFILIVIIISIRYFTVEHIYLLSDNRHYTHVFWRKVLNYSDNSRYAFVPFYFLAFLYYFDSMLTLRNKFSFHHASTTLGHFLCTCLSLIPSPLLEFRYFIVPFVIWRLLSYNSSQYKWASIGFDFLWYTLVNSLTLYIFFWHPFEWTSQPGTLQRFMW